jgi:tricorn protease
MPRTGGLPVRRTWHGGASTIVGWKTDGVLVYATQRFTTLPGWHLVTLELKTGTETRVPLFDAADGAWDDAGTVYFTRYRFQGSHTKRYKGGTAQSIWKFTPGSEEAISLTADFAGTDHRPMWWNGRVWFRSDRDGTMNLWSMLPDGSGKSQHTFHEGWDVKDPSLGSGRIVYQLGADLWLYDIAAGETGMLDIDLPSDFDQMRERWITEPMDWMTASELSSDGGNLVLTARGQVFVAPVQGGRLVEVTRRNGVRYRQGRLLPDGKTILVLSDESGEVEWWKFPADGSGEGEQLSTNACTLRYDGVVSPDGKTVVSWDHNQELWLYTLEDGSGRKIDFSPQWGFSTPHWSPDSRWLAYGMGAGNSLNRLWLYDTKNDERIALTTDRYDSYNAVFSPDGKAVYLLSDRHLESRVFAPWGSRQPEPFFDRRTGIYRIPLKADDRSPFQPDDELYEPEKKEENGEEKKNGKGKKSKKDDDKDKGVQTVCYGCSTKPVGAPASSWH